MVKPTSIIRVASYCTQQDRNNAKCKCAYSIKERGASQPAPHRFCDGTISAPAKPKHFEPHHVPCTVSSYSMFPRDIIPFCATIITSGRLTIQNTFHSQPPHFIIPPYNHHNPLTTTTSHQLQRHAISHQHKTTPTNH